ncbi:MAG TPA: gliding-motility protein MglA [Herpetosiphonaceae bacterium]
MPTMDFATDTIHFKLVYHGPQMCGKLSSMQSILAALPEDSRSPLGSYATETKRHVFFDCLLAGFPPISGFMPRFHAHTLPGAVLYEKSYAEVLEGADGVVYVADSQRDFLQNNIRYLQMLARIITDQNRKFSEFPLVLQYNKRDIPNAVPLDVMDKYLNPPQMGWQRFATVATRKPGGPQPAPDAMAPFEALCRLVASRVG